MNNFLRTCVVINKPHKLRTMKMCDSFPQNLLFSRDARIRFGTRACDLKFANWRGILSTRREADQPRVKSVALMLTAASVPGGAIDWGIRIDLRSNEILRQAEPPSCR